MLPNFLRSFTRVQKRFFSFYKAFKRAKKTLELCTNRYKGPETPWNFIRNNTRGQKWPQSVGWGPKQPLNFRRSFKIGQRGFELCTMLYKRPETLSSFVKSARNTLKVLQAAIDASELFARPEVPSYFLQSVTRAQKLIWTLYKALQLTKLYRRVGTWKNLLLFP